MLLGANQPCHFSIIVKKVRTTHHVRQVLVQPAHLTSHILHAVPERYVVRLIFFRDQLTIAGPVNV